MDPVTLGQRVLVTRVLERRRHAGGRNVWEPVDPYPLTGIIGPVPCIIVGVRTLANGRMSYSRYDGEGVFRPEEHFPAYLVAYDLRRTPVYALPEHTLEES